MRALNKISVCFISLNFGVAMSVSASTLAIPNVPLQTGSDVPPNIMFILDNSLSMSLEHMPDQISYGWPLSKGTSSGTNRSFKGLGTNASYRWYYSSKVNTIYYDPNVVYTLPVGETYTPTYNSARSDGFLAPSNSSNPSRDLRDEFQLEYDQWNANYNGYVNTGRIIFTSGGFYYQFNASLPGCNGNELSNNCYQYVSLNIANNEQKQNFAIWYSYYRSRLLLSRTAIIDAFSTLPENVRVGYTNINRRNTVESYVKEFSGANRTSFMNWLRNFSTSSLGSYTPLRGALTVAGEYFSTAEPYRVDANPKLSSSVSNPVISCRQNFSILMTDGAWSTSNAYDSGNFIKVGNVDGDKYSNTLADVASSYYVNDLVPSLTDNVPKRKTSSPNWQHMVTFGVGLGVDGTLDPNVAKNYTQNDNRWTNPFYSADLNLGLKYRTDDLLHSSVNSDGRFLSAKDPKGFSAQLAEALKSIIERTATASNLAATSTSLLQENSVFQASFDTTNWSGNLVSVSTDDLSVQWTSNFPVWDSRKIYFSRGTDNTLQEFKWTSLNTSEKAAFSNNQQIFDYLRGERTNEKPNGILRSRVSLLGDIAHSTPVYVGAPQNRNYQRYSWDGADKYVDFLKSNQGRSPLVFVGANDGMLHAFNAKPSVSSKGLEVFAYVPQKMLTSAADLKSYTQDTYAHRFYVDGSPTVSDVFINGKWRSVLVSTLGRGGNSVFALDVTDPTKTTLLWDLTIPELGIMTAKPIITRLNDGTWSAVMPYGYNNTANKNGLLVINIADGTQQKLDLPSEAGFLAQPEGWDMNRNGNTDWFFAGDLNGNVWKFDLSSANSWAVAYNNTPLFIAKDASNNFQPISGGITLTSHPQTGELWLFFGTGKYLETGDSLNADKQSYYGIIDRKINNRSQLVSRTITNSTYTNGSISEVVRIVSEATSGDMSNKLGWYMDLIDSRERVTSKSSIVGTNLVLNTIIPDSDLCNPQGDGWIMSIDPFTGSRLKYHLFDLSRDEDFNNDDGVLGPGGKVQVVGGLKFVGMPGEPVFVGEQMLVGDSRVSIDSRLVNLQLRRGRISWREVVN